MIIGNIATEAEAHHHHSHYHTILDTAALAMVLHACMLVTKKNSSTWHTEVAIANYDFSI